MLKVKEVEKKKSLMLLAVMRRHVMHQRAMRRLVMHRHATAQDSIGDSKPKPGN